MKKKIMITIFAATIMIVAGYNIYSSQKNVTLSDLALANVEALAGCEDSSQTLFGREATLNCTNSNGESYQITACDFSLSYDTDCTGRPAN